MTLLHIAVQNENKTGTEIHQLNQSSLSVLSHATKVSMHGQRVANSCSQALHGITPFKTILHGINCNPILPLIGCKATEICQVNGSRPTLSGIRNICIFFLVSAILRKVSTPLSSHTYTCPAIH